MIQEALKHYQFTSLACFVLLLFFSIYSVAVFNVFRKKSNQAHREAELLPLEDL